MAMAGLGVLRLRFWDVGLFPEATLTAGDVLVGRDPRDGTSTLWLLVEVGPGDERREGSEDEEVVGALAAAEEDEVEAFVTDDWEA